MTARTSPRLPPPPSPRVMDELRRRVAAQDLPWLEALFALRMTSQQVDNMLAERMAGTVGSPARWQVLMMLWAARGRGVPHKDIVEGMGVTRATVSGLMAGLEREGIVSSSVNRDDRREQLAALTDKGEAIMEKAIQTNSTRLRRAFAHLSPDELATLKALLDRVRESFAASEEASPSPSGPG